MIGLDSCAIIDLLRDKGNIAHIVLKNEGNIAFSDLSFFETYRGTSSRKRVKELFQRVYSAPITIAVLEKALEIFHKQIDKGKEISTFDCIIIASFLEKNIYTIVSNDKHFLEVDEITVIQY